MDYFSLVSMGSNKVSTQAGIFEMSWQARHGEARRGLAWRGGVWQAGQGWAGRGPARHGKARFGRRGAARRGEVWRGKARQAWHGRDWQAWRGEAGQGGAWLRQGDKARWGYRVRIPAYQIPTLGSFET